MVKSPPQEAATPTSSFGDELDLLYRQHSALMWRALTAFSGDREIAQDAVAEAFAQAIARGSAIHSPDKWVWKAAYRIAAGELHRRRALAGEPADVAVATDEPAWEIRSALAQLPPTQRIVVLLHYYAGYPAREVAQITSTTPAAVWMSLSRGRKQLRRILEAQDD